MKTFYCYHCGHQVFFPNTQCEHCGALLGYVPDEQDMGTFFPLQDNQALWQSQNPQHAGQLYKPCLNYRQHNVCNWMLHAGDAAAYCVSCQLTRVIPNLQEGSNLLYWSRLEAAKRRFLYLLQQLNLMPTPKLHDDDMHGMAFDFLSASEQTPVLTGHEYGLITINVAEADSSYREWTRESMHEPYRTLLGHFRHESGHYFFDHLIEETPWLPQFRALFGDESRNYAEALAQHYEFGAPLDWQQHYVSSYASMHPWEDWAETWAHYLHMMDTLDTAYHSGLNVQPYHLFEPAMQFAEPPLGAWDFDQTLANWFALSYVLNALNRSMGLADAYPFALSQPVLDKLRFIHQVVLAAGAAQQS